MSHATGKVVAAIGAAITLVAMFLTWYGSGSSKLTYWQLNKRWDVVTAVVCGAIILLALMTLARPVLGASIALIVLSAGLCGNVLYYAVEPTAGIKAGGYVGAAGGVIALFGALAIARTDLTLRGAGPASAFGAPVASAAFGPPDPSARVG